MALSRLLQLQVPLRFCRLRFPMILSRQCESFCSNGGVDRETQLMKDFGEDETQMAIDEPLVKEEPKNDQMVTHVKDETVSEFSDGALVKKESAAYSGSSQAKRLNNVFHNQYEEDNYTQKLSDAILSCAKFANPKAINIMSQFTNLLHGEQKQRPRDGELEKEFPTLQRGPNSLGHLIQMLEGVESSSFSHSSQDESDDLKESSVESVPEEAEDDIVKPETTISSFQSLEHEEKLCGTDMNNHSDMRGLTDSIRPHENAASEAATDFCDHGEDASLADSGESDIDLNSTVHAPSYPNSKKRKQVEELVRVREESKENKVTLWFLDSSSTTRTIEELLGGERKISNVDFMSCSGPSLRAARVYFKGNNVDEGFKQHGGSIVMLKPGTSLPNVTAPARLLGDPLAPAALIKFPARTVKLEGLSHAIATAHLKEAFAFCESKVSGCFFGSNYSAAYVEFETELGKEKALGKQSINVMGKNLRILRIDSPRTTIVRFMEAEPIRLQTVELCKSLGKIRSIAQRSGGILDVNFALDEWPNMLTIINRLNGYELEGRILKAEPAPWFPTDVLLALWLDREGREHVEATARSLLRKVIQVPNTHDFASTQHDFLHRAFKA